MYVHIWAIIHRLKRWSLLISLQTLITRVILLINILLTSPSHSTKRDVNAGGFLHWVITIVSGANLGLTILLLFLNNWILMVKVIISWVKLGISVIYYESIWIWIISETLNPIINRTMARLIWDLILLLWWMRVIIAIRRSAWSVFHTICAYFIHTITHHVRILLLILNSHIFKLKILILLYILLLMVWSGCLLKRPLVLFSHMLLVIHI